MTLIPGIILALLVATLAWLAGAALPLIGAPVFAILFGMLLAFIKRPQALEAGLKFTGKKGLQGAIILLGFGMNLGAVARAGLDSLLVLAFTLAAAGLVAFFAARALKVGRNQGILVGVGTAICGGSAIAATAPVIGASDEEVAHSISTVFLFNIVAVFIFPPLGRLLGLGDLGFGMWAGTAINDTSSVVAAAYSWNAAAGDYATVVKLTRTLFIIPITLGIGLALRRRAKATGGGEAGTRPAALGAFPWFILGFALASLIRTLGILPEAATTSLALAGRFLIAAAMAAIGLNTRLGKLLRNGFAPIALGLACWAAVALASLAAQRITGSW